MSLPTPDELAQAPEDVVRRWYSVCYDSFQKAKDERNGWRESRNAMVEKYANLADRHNALADKYIALLERKS